MKFKLYIRLMKADTDLSHIALTLPCILIILHLYPFVFLEITTYTCSLAYMYVIRFVACSDTQLRERINGEDREGGEWTVGDISGDWRRAKQDA